MAKGNDTKDANDTARTPRKHRKVISLYSQMP